MQQVHFCVNLTLLHYISKPLPHHLNTLFYKNQSETISSHPTFDTSILEAQGVGLYREGGRAGVDRNGNS